MPAAIGPPVRVLHVLGSLGMGGTERRLIDGLAPLREEATQEFFLVSGVRGALADEAARLGAVVHVAPSGRISMLIAWASLLRRQPRYDVVHAHVWLASAVFLAIAWIAGVPRRIAHFRSTGGEAPDSTVRGLREFALRRLLRACATHVVGVSGAALSSGIGKGMSQGIVLHSGVPVRPATAAQAQDVRHRYAPNGGPLLLQVGRLGPPKEPEFSLRVLAELRRTMPTATLVFVGDGPQRERLALVAQELGVSDGISFAGMQSEVGPFLAAADVMLVPSTREGMPGVVIEAIATGLPVIGGPLPVYAEICSSLDGLLVLPWVPSRWAQAIPGVRRRAADDALAQFKGSTFWPETAHRRLKELWLR
jgi:glycosyltransferase involved in cell wall biosynthesis